MSVNDITESRLNSLLRIFLGNKIEGVNVYPENGEEALFVACCILEARGEIERIIDSEGCASFRRAVLVARHGAV